MFLSASSKTGVVIIVRGELFFLSFFLFCKQALDSKESLTKPNEINTIISPNLIKSIKKLIYKSV